MESLAPRGAIPSLSTYWIDRALDALSAQESAETVVAQGNAWSLVRSGDVVNVRFDYEEESELHEVIPVADLVAGLTSYREVVVQAIEGGHGLDERWWAQRNPGRPA